MLRSERGLTSKVERDEEVTVHEDENAHLWAVSYSDFLMALLSFFILFFSMETPQKKETFIRNLSQQFRGETVTQSNEMESSSSARSPASALKALALVDVKVEGDADNLIINFPDDLYLPGRHVFQTDKVQLFKTVLATLEPYRDHVRIYFEGHADNKPLKLHRNAIVTDNFVLSSLRANSALSLARDLGFSEKTMFIQAASSNLRNSRSLSVRIQSIQETAL